jgi:Mitochondrial carrier protein
MTSLTDFERAVTPFDVVKTRLQTQMPHKKSQANSQTCRHAPHISCTRSMSSYAASMSSSPATSSKLLLGSGSKSLPEELCLCFYEGNTVRAQRVTGFWDALLQVARFEGVRGLWKGVGTTL